MNQLLLHAHDWPKIVFPALPWAEKIVRPFIVYLFLLVAFRFSGKRELGQATLFDFLIILLISNVVQNAIIGDDNSILGGVCRRGNPAYFVVCAKSNDGELAQDAETFGRNAHFAYLSRRYFGRPTEKRIRVL